MKVINLDWTDFKSTVSARNVNMQWYLKGDDYKLFAFDGPVEYCTTITKEDTPDADQSDFETNYKDDANKTLSDMDLSGRNITRFAATEAGWSLLDNYVTLETGIYDDTNSKGAGFVWMDLDGNLLDCTSYHYDDQGTLLTSQASIDTDCVRTDWVFKFGQDIDLDRGAIMQYAPPVSNLYLFGAFGVLSGGTVVSVKEFIRNLNLHHCPTNYPIDGKSSKLLRNDLGIGLEANQSLIRCYHDVGVKHNFQVGIGYYRE